MLLSLLFLGCLTRQTDPGFKLTKDLSYGQFGTDNTLDLYVPSTGAGPFPVVVAIHGGGWQAGSKADMNGGGLTAKGIAVASINYRFSATAHFPAQIEDCQAAVRWLREHAKQYNLDSAHFAAFGGSAGGHLSALLGTAGEFTAWESGAPKSTTSTRIQAIAELAGPTDMAQMPLHMLDGKPWAQSYTCSAVQALFGGTLDDKKGLVEAANPIHYVTKHSPPFYIVHGDKDAIVPFNQSELLRDALTKVGVEVTLHRVPGGDHGANDAAGWQGIVDFLVKKLKAG